MPEHDLLFKKLLRTFLRDFLRILSPQVAERLDFSRTIYLDKELFTDWPQARRRELDLLARVPLLDSPDRFVLIHVEIEARATPGIGMRLRAYRNQIQQRHEDAVISAVVFLSRGKPGAHVETLEEDLPYLGFGAFRYVALGLDGCDAEEYLARSEPLAWGLAALMRRGSGSRAEHKLACLRRIAGAELSGEERLVLVNCVETYLELTPEEAAEFALLSPVENQEVQAMVMSWADRMKEEGRLEGLEIGRRETLQEARTWADRMREEGQRTGLKEGIRQILLHQLERRFGSLPPIVLRRIRKIDSVDHLHLLAEQVLTARSIDEIELG
jgi:Putative transposase, YhgA-like